MESCTGSNKEDSGIHELMLAASRVSCLRERCFLRRSAASSISHWHPRLSPWASFLRRVAAQTSDFVFIASTKFDFTLAPRRSKSQFARFCLAFSCSLLSLSFLSHLPTIAWTQQAMRSDHSRCRYGSRWVGALYDLEAGEWACPASDVRR